MPYSGLRQLLTYNKFFQEEFLWTDGFQCPIAGFVNKERAECREEKGNVSMPYNGLRQHGFVQETPMGKYYAKFVSMPYNGLRQLCYHYSLIMHLITYAFVLSKNAIKKPH